MVYESNKILKKNGFVYKEQKLAVDTGDVVRDINIQEAVIHVLDSNGDEPILNEFKLDLSETVYKFLYKHVEKSFKSDELTPAIFNPNRNMVKEIAQDFLNGTSTDILDLSKDIARQLFSIMKCNINIPSCDLVVVSMVTEQGPLIGILKLDYVNNFTHQVEFIDNKIGIGIVPQVAGLPASSKKIEKAAFIKPIRQDNTFDLWIIDKEQRSDEYGENYWTNSFLDCSAITSNKLATKLFIQATEQFVRDNINEDAAKAEEVRSKIKAQLKINDEIEIEGFSQELFREEPKAKEKFETFVKGYGLDDVIKVDKEFVEKKLKRVRLKIDKDIDLYISEEAYNDLSKFEVVRNGDGSINMTIKHVMNYIEK